MKNIVIPTLEADDIEVKIKQVTQKGAFALLYKTARTDMRYLDDAFGVSNWQNEYQMVGDMLFCTIYLWDEDKQQWIKKQSNGIESREDGEGNEIKGLASDCMKRAGFVAGIGRELYSSPRVFLNVATKQDGEFKGKPVYKLEDPWAKYIVTEIGYDDKRRINKLIIANEKTGEIVYRYGMNTAKAKSEPKAEQKAKPKAEQKAEPKAEAKQEKVEPKPTESKLEAKINATVETSKTLPNPEMPPHEKVFNSFLERHHIDKKKFVELRAKAVNGGKSVSAKSFKELTPDEWILLLATMENLYDEGFFEGVA